MIGFELLVLYGFYVLFGVVALLYLPVKFEDEFGDIHPAVSAVGLLLFLTTIPWCFIIALVFEGGAAAAGDRKRGKHWFWDDKNIPRFYTKLKRREGLNQVTCYLEYSGCPHPGMEKLIIEETPATKNISSGAKVVLSLHPYPVPGGIAGKVVKRTASTYLLEFNDISVKNTLNYLNISYDYWLAEMNAVQKVVSTNEYDVYCKYLLLPGDGLLSLFSDVYLLIEPWTENHSTQFDSLQLQAVRGAVV